MFFFPFSTLHELNLDWILAKMKYLLGTTEENNRKADYAVETADEAKTIAEQAAQAQIADGAVTTVKLANNAVTTAKLANGAVTFAKLDADLKENLGAVILPTGDTTDRKAEIESKLSTYGYCEFREGDYYLSAPVRLYDGQSIFGIGKKSVIHKTSDSVTPGMFYATGTSHNITIRDLKFKGVNNTNPGAAPATGEYAIMFEDHAGAVTIDNCEFHGLYNCGILRTSGYSVTNDFAMQITNCLFRACGTGMKLDEYGEFVMTDNSSFIGNYVGARVQGGNNKFINCGFDANTTGFYLYDTAVGTNDGHGSAVGCSFNHNTGNSIKADYVDYGFTFSACNVFDGDILLSNSQGIVFDGCIIQGHQSGTVHADITMVNCPGAIDVFNTIFIYRPVESKTNTDNYYRGDCRLADGTEMRPYFMRLPVTYVSQSCVTESDLDLVRFYDVGGMIYAKINLRLTSQPGENFVTIGNISLPFNLLDSNQAVLASQSNAANLLINITASGDIQIYNTGTASGWYRGQFVLY